MEFLQKNFQEKVKVLPEMPTKRAGFTVSCLCNYVGADRQRLVQHINTECACFTDEVIRNDLQQS